MTCLCGNHIEVHRIENGSSSKCSNCGYDFNYEFQMIDGEEYMVGESCGTPIKVRSFRDIVSKLKVGEEVIANILTSPGNIFIGEERIQQSKEEIQ